MKARIRLELTPEEKTALDMEINRQLLEHTRNRDLQMEAVFLWAVREVFGCGAGKLKQLYDRFYHGYQELLRHYEMGEQDAKWLVCYKLKEIGADVEQWRSDWEKVNRR